VSERAPLPTCVATPERGSVLLLSPHADDDIIGCGGTLALHNAQGDGVHVVVTFTGEAGDPEGHHDPDALRTARQREAQAGGAHLGLESYEFWPYQEGHEAADEEIMFAAQRIAGVVSDRKPDIVYAPWVGEHHIDHHNLARAARIGLELVGFQGQAWGYEVWTPLVPTLIVDITAQYELKVAALEEHRTQLEYTDHVHKALGMQAQRSLYLPEGSRYGEAFRPLGPVSADDRGIAEAAR